MKYDQWQNYAVWLMMLCTIAMVSCAGSTTNQSTPETPQAYNPQQKNGELSSMEPPDIAADSQKQAENVIYRDTAGTIVGQIKVSVLMADEASTGGQLDWIHRWEKILTETGYAKIKISFDRAQPPHAIATDAPLLFVTSYPTDSRIHEFVEQLAQYVQRGGLVFFDGSEPPQAFVAKGMIRRIDENHPLLRIPYTIEGLSRRDLPRVIEIDGKTAALVFGLGDSPTQRKLSVNLIAYAIAHYPQGKSYLKADSKQTEQKDEKIEEPPIPPAMP